MSSGGSLQHRYNFMSTMPDTLLRPAQISERYGMSKATAPAVVKEQVQQFLAWATSAINLERGVRYAAAIQTATAETNEASLLAYMGYSEMYFPLRRATLRAYLDPEVIMHFVAYLRARGAKKGHILKHISLARKVCVDIRIPAAGLESVAGFGGSTAGFRGSTRRVLGGPPLTVFRRRV